MVEIAGVVGGGLIVVAAITVWRLSSAPFDAKFIRPYLEQEINRAGLGFSVQLTEAKIGWHGFHPVLDLHFHGVSVVGENGAPMGAVQDGTLGFAVRDLLVGRVTLVEIAITRPTIAIVRDKSGRFSLRLGEAAAGDDTNAGSLLDQFSAAPNGQDSWSGLERIHLVDGRATIDDQKLGLTWTAPDIDIDLARNAIETTAQVNIALDLPQHAARLKGVARYVRAQAKTDISIDISDLDVATVTPLSALLTPLAALSVPVSGRVHAVIDSGGNLIGGDASLSGGQGQMVLPDYFPQPLSFQSAGLNLHFTDAPRRMVLDRMAIDFGDARLSVAGAVDFNGPAIAVEANVDLANIPFARFDALWPMGFAVGGRDWVTTHIPAGVIKSGAVHLIGSGQTHDLASFQFTKVEGSFDYSGLEVHYFPALPPIRNCMGSAVFDQRGMTVTIDSGSLGDIGVSKGAVSITGFDQDDRAIDIGLTADGPLKTALAVLDKKPLGYAHDLGLSPEAVGGHLNVRANFAFPLIKELRFSEIALGVKGALDGVAAAGVVGPRDLTSGAFTIALDKKGMTLIGTARLSGVPVGLNWQESFQQTDKMRSHIAFKSELDDSDRTALALVSSDFVTLHGKIPVTGSVAIDRAGTTSLDVTADIAATELGIDSFGVRKPAGDKGSADLSLIFSGGILRAIPHLRVISDRLEVTGLADFGADGALRHAQLPHVSDRWNDYALTVDAIPGTTNAFAISVKGARFNAEPLLAKKSSAEPISHTPHVDLTLAIDQLFTSPETRFDSVTGSATLSGSRLDRAALKATAGGAVTLDYTPVDAEIALHFAAQDAGRALAALGVTRGVRGGTLTIDGKTNPGEGARLTTGSIDMLDFRLTNAPIIARLVNAVSLTGFVDLLSNQGLAFDRLSGRIDYMDGKITFHDGRSAGALGLSFEGDVDFDRNQIALKGTVVPANTLNRILAAIPVLGDIITGGQRGGLIGWTYTVSGTPDDPRVSVNPLSMFAPGFLRNLFFLGPSEAERKVGEPPPTAGPAP